MKNLVFLITLCTFISAGFCLSYSPTEETFHLPDGSESGFILITNGGVSDVEVSVTKSGDYANWLFTNENFFTIINGTTKTFNYLINIPEGLDEGTYNMTLLFNEFSPSENVSNIYTFNIHEFVDRQPYCLYCIEQNDKVYGKELYFNEILEIEIGTNIYEIDVIDMSSSGSTATINISKNGIQNQIKVLGVDSYEFANNHLEIQKIGECSTSVLSFENYMCNFLITADTDDYTWERFPDPTPEYTTNIYEEQAEQSALSDLIRISTYGKLTPCGRLILKTQYDTKPLSMSLIIEGFEMDALISTTTASGLSQFQIPCVEPGPLTITAATPEGIENSAVFILTGEVTQGPEDEEENDEPNDENDPEQTSPTLDKFTITLCKDSSCSTATTRFNPDDRIYVQVRREKDGVAILNANVRVNTPCLDTPYLSTSAIGIVSFAPQPDGKWCEGIAYEIRVKKPGFEDFFSTAFTVNYNRITLSIDVEYLNDSFGNNQISETAYTNKDLAIQVLDENGNPYDYEGFIFAHEGGERIQLNAIDGLTTYLPSTNESVYFSILATSDFFGVESDEIDLIFLGSSSSNTITGATTLTRAQVLYNYILPLVGIGFVIFIILTLIYKRKKHTKIKENFVHGTPNVKKSLPGGSEELK